MLELSLRNLLYTVPFPSFGSAVLAGQPANISRAISLISARSAARAIFLMSAINPR